MTRTPEPSARTGDRPDARAVERRIERSARDLFGFRALRPGQAHAIRTLLEGRDTLAVMPTGGGKSAVYQLGGLLREGLTVVVSPLVALQSDQVESMASAGIANGAALNATLPDHARANVLDRLAAGRLAFLLLAPEQLLASSSAADLVERLAAARPTLFVVDEAHCISDWGHDFRPEYLRLADVADRLGRPPVLALTATASPEVRDEIVERLRMRDPAVVVRGFDRPNIWLGVETFEDAAAKLRALVEQVQAEEPPGIVYAATRRRVEEIAALLREAGVDASAYHAGLGRRERSAVQQAFMRGECDVMVATVAFGMGVDKADVRFVCHADAPGSVDAYHQQFGRAGRDGLPARAHLLFRPADLSLRRFFAARGALEPRDVQRLLAALERLGREASTKELAQRARLGRSRTATALTRLADAGLISLLPDGTVRAADGDASPASAVEAAAEAVERHRLLERTRVEMLRQYAETRDCRRRFILNYFGQAAPEPCGNCDTCDAGLPQALEQETDVPFPINGSVRHPRFGPGRVVRYEDGRIVILFEDAGYRTLLTDAAVRAGRLRPAP